MLCRSKNNIESESNNKQVLSNKIISDYSFQIIILLLYDLNWKIDYKVTFKHFFTGWKCFCDIIIVYTVKPCVQTTMFWIVI